MRAYGTGHEAPSPYRYEPKDMAGALQFAKAVVKSGFAPHIRSIETAFAILATGAELGLSAMQAIRSIHIIDGKPSLSADLVVGLVKRSPVCEWFRMVESTPTEAIFETQRRGEPEPTRLEYTSEDARRAGLKDRRNWRQHPAAMLRARAASALARAVYPDLLAGIGLPEEEEEGATLPTLDVEPLDAEGVEDVVPARALPAPQAEGFGDVDALEAAASHARESSELESEEDERPEEETEEDLMAWRIRVIDHLDTKAAARRIARELVQRELAEDPAAAMKLLVSAVEESGVVPTEATVEDLALAWHDVETQAAT